MLLAGVCLPLALLCPRAIAASDVVISEIMFNPTPGPDPDPGGTNIIDGDEFEFLEIYNTGTNAVDLDGWTITDGVTFNFSGTTILSPGGYIVLVEDENHFTSRYPWAAASVAGEWSGKLSDGGEQLVLKDSTNGTVFSVDYNDSSSWPQRADGEGASLVLSDYGGDPDEGSTWCDSDMFLGTPGATGLCAQTDILVNEIFAHTDPPFEDAVEVINLSGSSVDMAGWYLSDSPLQPRKYRVTNTTVSAGGYHVFYEYQFNTNTPSFDTNNIPFALSEFGDEAYLTAPNPGTNQLRLVDIVEFGGTPNNVSLGRFPNGTGDFFLMDTNTFGTVNPASLAVFRTGGGASNSGMRVGPVVINEIMYHPIQTNDGAYEYIELHNISGSAVDISGWSISGVGWTNPPATTIGAGAFLVIASNRPNILAEYGLPGSQVLGNWPGRLQNNGETIVLRNEEGAEIDRVEYDHDEPWSVAADGYGPSLERIRATDDGNTPVNWAASLASTNWQQVTWTQAVASGNKDIRFWLDFEGKAAIDDVSVRLNGVGGNLVNNPGFESGMSSWTSFYNHARSRVESGIGRSGNNALVVAGNLSRFISPGAPQPISVIYGDASSNQVRSAQFFASAGNYVVSYWVRRLGLGGSVFGRFNGANRELDVGHRGTPGAANSITSGVPPIGITDVSHATNIVGVSTANVIRATIEGAPASSVSVIYRLVTSGTYEYTDAHYTSIAMADNGVAPDLAAGDGEYAVAMPAFSTNRTVVRYSVEAVAANGSRARSPHVDDPSTDYGYWIQSGYTQTNIPNWQLFVDGFGNTGLYPHAYRAIGVSPDGQVFPDIRYRHRGNPVSSKPWLSGIALRMQRGRLYDTWFAKNQEGINYRHRGNDNTFRFRRVVNEWLAYWLQRQLGLVAPNTRHTCIWIDGVPTITLEFEAPEEGFLENNGLDDDDYISRAGYSGRRIVDGNNALDNFASVNTQLENVSGAAKTTVVRTNLWYESIRQALALVSLASNGDQYFYWNMFQHRQWTNGLWAQYPWDVDLSFNIETNGPRNIYMPEIHPYYETPLHGALYDPTPAPNTLARTLGVTLFYPESGSGSQYTFPYRYRHQLSLWRHYHTIFTTNYLHPVLDDMETRLTPAYTAIGEGLTKFQNKVQEVKDFIVLRRDFLHDGSWSDRDTSIWNVANVYSPTGVVINEIMYDPGTGGEYLELCNVSTQTVDLSWWELQAGAESYRLPHGTMLGPTSYLVVADTQSSLTNAYSELDDPANVVHRYEGLPIWDWPLNFLHTNEYRTRIVEIPQLTLPNLGATIALYDLTSNLVDSVPYDDQSPWPSGEGSSLELVHPLSGNQSASVWRTSFRIGTPGMPNTATNDTDGDRLVDQWEQQIVDFFGGVSDITDVDPEGDEDNDGLDNNRERVLGFDPTIADGSNAQIRIVRTNGAIKVEFETRLLSGAGYQYYKDRLYTLKSSTDLPAGDWPAVSNYTGLSATGNPIVHTNNAPLDWDLFRYDVNLQPDRP